jgi:hypothetical protein
MRPRATPALLLLATVGVACSQAYPDPFQDSQLSPTATPPPDAQLIFSGNNHAPGGGRELYAIAASGASQTRLTFCSDADKTCQTLEAALAPDRARAVVRRVLQDTNGDGKLDDADDAALVYVDLANQVEAVLVPSSQRVTGVDWSPTDDVLVYSAQGDGGEDLFRTTPIRPTPDNAQQTRNLTCPLDAVTGRPNCDPGIRERRPRIDPTGSIAAFERIDATGKSRVFIFQSSASLIPVTAGGAGSDPLPGTPYIVGSDADPSFSPDSRSLVFRRLTSAGTDGRGTWDVLIVGNNGTGLTTIASGPTWRGAPGWGTGGIVFPEQDPATGGVRLRLLQPDGSGAHDVLSLAAGFVLENPRWLR